jgi:hypothetical protein
MATKYYLVKDFSTQVVSDKPNRTPIFRVVSDDVRDKDNLWKEIDSAKNGGKLLSFYEIGPCVLDLS